MSYAISGFIGEGNATADALRAYLTANPGRASVIINSPGGIASEGAAIRAELERHGNATVLIEGLAASAASLAAMGGKTIVMHADALLMIHNPSGLTIGTASAHRKTASTLDQFEEVYAAAYARASGNPVEMVRAWMEEEVWLSAEEALALRFIDRIEGNEPVAVSPFDFTMYRNPPAHLVQLWRASLHKKELENA